jgi:hypothetical protein
MDIAFVKVPLMVGYGSMVALDIDLVIPKIFQQDGIFFPRHAASRIPTVVWTVVILVALRRLVQGGIVKPNAWKLARVVRHAVWVGPWREGR